ncbi:MAG: transcription termination/antitermination protein NusG [Candidatus Omnitrophota bacterium]|nr:MAG: transcription termination/antitermination protein NusG [Candidatus Omnitrophota bacterium]
MRRWYVIHTQTGYEMKVKEMLENRIKQEKKEDLFSRILIPTEEVSEFKGRQRKVVHKKLFPGYILIEMELNDKTLSLVRSIPGVSGFVGLRNKPFSLQEEEVEKILKQIEKKEEKPKASVSFKKGEGVRIKEGAFANFMGTVEQVDEEKGRLKVSVSMFGRITPVEVEYWQVEKI